MRRAAVTGAAGFLGRHITRAFQEAGWEVIAFDLALLDQPGVQTVKGDLTDSDAVDSVVADCDVVAHVGAIGDVYLAGDQPTLAARVNVVGTSNVIEAALRHQARVVYASTWEVYGRPRYEPVDEDHPTTPDHPYSITKLAGESLILAAAELRSLPALALRLGTAYGPGLRPNSVFRIFIDRAQRGEPITIQGDGSQGRQFTHASDIARAFVLAAESDASGKAVNVVATEMVTIRELAQRITSRFPTEVTYDRPRPGDVPPAHVSSKLAAELLGWQEDMAFDRGLDDLMGNVPTGT